MLEIDDQNCDITQTRSPRSEVAKALMPGSIDDQKSGKVYVNRKELFAFSNLLFEFFLGEESSSDLLGYSSCLSLLDVGPSDFVEESSLASIDVA